MNAKNLAKHFSLILLYIICLEYESLKTNFIDVESAVTYLISQTYGADIISSMLNGYMF